MQRDTAASAARSAAHADAWSYGGGSIYATPVIDTRAQPAHLRHRQSLAPDGGCLPARATTCYTSSLVALDLRTGRLIWSYQQVPHDRWGYDVASSPVLLDVTSQRNAHPGRGAGEQDRLGLRA